MTDRVTQYFDDAIQTLRSVEASDRKGEILSLAAGIERGCELVERCRGTGNKLMFIGNGGSASIASHFALDFWHAGGFKALCFNDGAQLTCLANDHGYEEVFSRPVATFAEDGDLLVAISSSGGSANILKAVEAARERGCRVLTLSGFESDNPLRDMGDLNLWVPAAHYGYVECLHGLLIHSILDLGK